MKKEPVIKTKRMLLSPMSDQEIEKLIETTESVSRWDLVWDCVSGQLLIYPPKGNGKNSGRGEENDKLGNAYPN